MRPWAALLLALFLLATTAQAQPNWVQLDDPPKENQGDGAAAADLVDVFYATNVTHLFFREDLASPRDLNSYTYTVYMDKPQGGTYNQDFRLVYSQSGSYLETWDGSAWNYQEDISVQWDSTNSSIIFRVPVTSVGGVGESNVKVWFENYLGVNAFTTVEDRAPNNGEYNINKKAIPNIPLLVLPAFVGGLAATLLLLRKRFSKVH